MNWPPGQYNSHNAQLRFERPEIPVQWVGGPGTMLPDQIHHEYEIAFATPSTDREIQLIDVAATFQCRAKTGHVAEPGLELAFGDHRFGIAPVVDEVAIGIQVHGPEDTRCVPGRADVACITRELRERFLIRTLRVKVVDVDPDVL